MTLRRPDLLVHARPMPGARSGRVLLAALTASCLVVAGASGTSSVAAAPLLVVAAAPGAPMTAVAVPAVAPAAPAAQAPPAAARPDDVTATVPTAADAVRPRAVGRPAVQPSTGRARPVAEGPSGAAAAAALLARQGPQDVPAWQGELTDGPDAPALQQAHDGRRVTSGEPRGSGGSLVTRGIPDPGVYPTTPATTNLLDGPQGSGTVGTDGAAVTVGTVVVTTSTLVAVTVLGTHGVAGITLASVSSTVALGSPYLIMVPAGSSPLSVTGQAGSGLRLAVRTVRSAQLGADGTSAQHLVGAGDAVLVSYAEPAGVAGVALRLATPSGRAGAVVNLDAPDADAGVVVADDPAGGGYRTVQGLPVEETSGTVLLWAPEPLHATDAVDVQASLTVLPASLVSPVAGTTAHVQTTADAPVLLHLPFTDAAPGSFTTLSAAAGHLAPTTGSVGLRATTPGLRRSYLAGAVDEPVASFSGAGLFGPPTSTDLQVHLEAVRTLSEASTTSLTRLSVDAPGLVYDLTASGLSSTDLFEIDAAAASTVSFDVCYVNDQSAAFVCQPYVAGQDVTGLALHASADDILLVARATAPDSGTSYADEGTWVWRLVALAFDGDGDGAENPTPGQSYSYTATLHGFASSRGRLLDVTCYGGGDVQPYVGAENQGRTPSTATFAVNAQFSDSFPVPANATFAQTYAVPLGPYDGTTDDAGSSGTRLENNAAFGGEGYVSVPGTGVQEPLAAFTDRDVTATGTTSVRVAVSGPGLVVSPDLTTSGVSLDCEYAFVPAITS